MEKSQFMWIDGKCFMVPDEATHTEKEYKDLYNIDDSPLDNWNYKAQFTIPLYYCKQIQQKGIKDEINDDINLIVNHFNKDQSAAIEIHGNSISCISSMIKNLHLMLINIRRVSKPMQFISIPTISFDIKKNFSQFKLNVMQQEYKGVEDSIFQKSEKLHLTITIFSLYNQNEIEEVIKCLHEYKNEILNNILNGNKALQILVQGVDCMQPNYNQCHVLYAKAKITEDVGINLQTIANSLNNFFFNKGFTKGELLDVKLHVTLMNSKYRKLNKGKKYYHKRLPFHAAGIIDEYKNHYFGKCNFDTIDLSLMSSVGDDGYYKRLTTIQI